MSDFVIAFNRDQTPFFHPAPTLLQEFCSVPGLSSNPPQVERHDGFIACLFNPSTGSLLTSSHLGLGTSAAERVFNAEFSRRHLFAHTDLLGSRPIWYIFNANIFAIASSQFMLSAFITSKEINMSAVSWFLSSGYVGHESYLTQIKRLHPDTALSFELETWSCQTERRARGWATTSRFSGRPQDIASLIGAVLDDLDLRKPTVVPISGGADSRVLLSELCKRHPDQVIPVTWGARDSFRTPEHDASVARAVCERLNLRFTYLEELSDWDDVSHAFQQFLQLSELIVDHLLMQRLHPSIDRWCAENDLDLMIRGDETFGWRPVGNEQQCRDSVDLVFADDIAIDWPELDDVWQTQQVPEFMRRKGDESLASYRDRLYREVRCPGVLAGLNGGFARHLEIVNPFLDPRIVEAFASLRDRLRTNKAAFQKYADTILPGQKFAEFSAHTETRDLLKNEQVCGYIRSRLQDGEADERFGHAIVERLERALAQPKGSEENRNGWRLFAEEKVVQIVGKKRLRYALNMMPSRTRITEIRMAFRIVMTLEIMKRFSEVQRKVEEAAVRQCVTGGDGDRTDVKSC